MPFVREHMDDSMLPADRDPRWVRATAAVLLTAVLWADWVTPVDADVPVLYVIPVMLFVTAGRYYEPLIVANIATILTLIGGFVSPPRPFDLAFVNRPLEILAIWITSGLVAYYRWRLEEWSARFSSERAARTQSIHRLEEIRQALDQAAIVAATDQRGVITYVNEKFSEISGYSREELLGQDHRIINSGYHPKEFIRDLWQTIARGGIWRGEIRNRAKNGSYYWVDTTIVPFMDDRGKPRHYLSIRSDITQRKRAEAKLLEQSALARLGQLAAVVAHEVRNPLAGVRGTLQVLRSRAGGNPQDAAVMDAMIARIDVLNAKVEDILRFARPRSPMIEAVDLRPVLADAIATARVGGGRECPDIQAEPSSVILRADREMLRDVLLNLLLNGCQSGTRSPVQVTVKTYDAVCRIEIADRGSGISEADAARVFEAFYTTKKAGTGLGLAIVQRLVTMQDGAIALVPREGGGTIARLDLPIATAAEQRTLALRAEAVVNR